MRLQQSYSGYYNGVWIRSSYEYALIKYFESINCTYDYEPMLITFDDGTNYIPDFIANGIVYEVKSDNTSAEGRRRLGMLQLEFGIQGVLVNKQELNYMYKRIPLDLNSIIKEWIDSPDTQLNASNAGSKNPRFGTKHTDETKELIAFKARERMQDPVYRAKMQASWDQLGARTKENLTGVFKVQRIQITCPVCQIIFERPPHLVSKHCSRKCSLLESSRLGRLSGIKHMEQRLSKIKDIALQWVCSNADHVLNVPFNKLSKGIQELVNLCYKATEVKDIRTIAKAFNATNGKDLLVTLKELAENVRRAKDE